jgi:hypothetical protein
MRGWSKNGSRSLAVSLHGGGWHARWQGEQAIHGLPLGAAQHVIDACGSQHIGDLVGIGHHRRRAARGHGAGEFGDANQGAFDVHMGIDEPGSHIAALHVRCLSRRIVTESHHIAVLDGDAGFDDAAGKNVDKPGVGQQQIRRGVTAGGSDDAF